MSAFEKKLSPLITLGTSILVIGLLYWGKPVLMPLAVSILLTFLLNPIVDTLHRKGLGRVPAVILVVILVFSLLGAVIWAMGTQVSSLAEKLPDYRENMRKKIADFRSAGEGTALDKVQRTFKELAGEFNKKPREAVKKLDEATLGGPEEEPASTAEQKEEPVPVVVEGENPTQRLLPVGFGSVLEMLATAGLVIVLVIFMLLRLQELRNRILRLVGHGRLTTTTKALDEASERISRYLLMQTIINATYGFSVGLGLYLIGLPSFVLWGFLAFLARFIPYVGPWLGALLPITFSLAVFDGWMQPLMVIGLIVVLELFSNMVMEPYLYGQSVGVSEVALIVAIAFWTWLWGPIGLALATPLTVCLVVVCKYIPELEFLEVLMGDAPVMDRGLIFYQRLLAMDQDEATDIVREYLKTNPVEQVFDELLIPALTSAKRDAGREKLTDENKRFIFEAMQELIEEVEVPYNGEENGKGPVFEGPSPPGELILGCPAYDQADEVALLMLRRLLDPKRARLEILSSQMLSSEFIAQVLERKPAVICIGALPPAAVAPTRYLCKRLRERFPDIKIVVGRWGLKGNIKENRDELVAAGADYVGTSVVETRSHLLQLLQILASQESPAQEPEAEAAAVPPSRSRILSRGKRA